jgi:hypothetical protein
MKMIRNSIQSLRKLRHGVLKLSFLVSTSWILPAIIQYNIFVTQVTETQAHDFR